MRLTTCIAIVGLICASAASHTSVPGNVGNKQPVEHTSIQDISMGNRLTNRIELAQQASNQCLTPYFWCWLPGYAPIGSACWCATPQGPVAGRVGIVR
jgi:hypothetical protein